MRAERLRPGRAGGGAGVRGGVRGAGVAFVPFFAIAGAGGLGGATAAEAAVARVAAAHGVSFAQVRLAWTLLQGPHVLAIPGTGDPAHVADNVAAGALRLSAEDLALLG
ncbi:aldo/keto reductase [Nonomuraea sp. NBC_01738]|uniref:aldo/keto reductase n=1 Tax=Nonomuraea sp. NBC_01738 TaxID=2976003 RepID=UPI002E0DF7E9